MITTSIKQFRCNRTESFEPIQYLTVVREKELTPSENILKMSFYRQHYASRVSRQGLVGADKSRNTQVNYYYLIYLLKIRQKNQGTAKEPRPGPTVPSTQHFGHSPMTVAGISATSMSPFLLPFLNIGQHTTTTGTGTVTANLPLEKPHHVSCTTDEGRLRCGRPAIYMCLLPDS